MICSSCGTPAPEGARFCGSCGQPLRAGADERRVVTVLFADLVGFTGLSEARDPEELKLLIDGCFETLVRDITNFGGRVDKIVGDAIVALFGAPVAHEDDPERAVRAALRMQETLATRSAELGAPVRMRIGVNTGEVLVGALRAGGDTTVMGDVVNIASRLQTIAAPGQVLVGPTTHAATVGVIAYEPLGAVAVRGREEVVDAWVATAALLQPGARRRRARGPLVGRERELGLADHALASSITHRRAQPIVLLGEAGVGKSRLAAELASLAAERHEALVLEGRCVPYGEANVWWPLAEAIRASCGVGPDDPHPIVHRRVAATLAAARGVGPDDGEVTRLVAGLLHLFGLDGPLRNIDPQRAREEVIRSLLGFLEAHLATRPVLLSVSDLHWGGTPVLELLGIALDRLSRSRFSLLVTARPPFDTSWAPSGGHHNAVVLTLDPLDRAAAACLLDSLIEGRIDAELRDALLDRAGGNPFFLEELVALVGPGEDRLVGTGGPGAPGALDRLPDTLRGLVAARIDGLSIDERRTLEDAAVLGRRGVVFGLVRMADADRSGVGVRSPEQVQAALDGLRAKDVLVVDATGAYEFRSDLVRDVAYSTLTKTDRAKRHFGIAEYLETNFVAAGEVDDTFVDMLAHHFAVAAAMARELNGVEGVPADVVDRALRWLTEAARRAEAADVFVVAERLFGQALDLLGDEPTAALVAARLGRAEARAEQHRLALAREDLAAALDAAELLEDAPGRARAIVLRGIIEQREGQLDAAVQTFAAAEDAYAALGDRGGMAEALRRRGLAEMFLGDDAAARRAIGAALDAFAALGDQRGQAWALQNLAWLAFNDGRVADAERRIEQSAEMFRTIGDSGGLGWTLGLQAWVRFHQGRYEEAEHLGDLILAEARGRGDRWAEGMMLVLAASVRLWTGRATGAVGRAGEALEVFRSIADGPREIQAACVLGRALIADGSVGAGFRTLDLAIESAADMADPGAAAVAASSAAASAVAVGDAERALRAAALVASDEPLDPAVLGEGDRLVALGLALAQLGELDEAVRHLAHAAETVDGEPPSGFALSALAVARAALGDGAGVAELVVELDLSERVTYLDWITAQLALAAAGGQAGPGALRRARELADGTEDRVVQALVRLAAAEIAEATGRADPVLRAEADRRLAELGITASGWAAVYRTAASAGAAGPSATGVDSAPSSTGA